MIGLLVIHTTTQWNFNFLRMEYKKYQHVERLGTSATRNIENGKCYIFPKLDGTNASAWANDFGIGGGSRRRELNETKDGDNAGFYKWLQQQNNIKQFLQLNPQYRLFGEWLVPHTIKDYLELAWRKFYVFDVMDENGNYLPYEQYSELLDAHGIEYIKPLAIIEFPNAQQLDTIMNTNTYLMREGFIGEGIVIKRYDFVNNFGHIVWAKMVRAEFKAEHGKHFGVTKEKPITEQAIVDKYITRALAEKEMAKIKVANDSEEWNMKWTTRLLGTIFHCLITEEAWNFIKEHKNPVIDFNRLMFLSSAKVKSYFPQYYKQ